MRSCVSWYFYSNFLTLENCNFKYQLLKINLYFFHLIKYCLCDLLLADFYMWYVNMFLTSQLCFFNLLLFWDIDSVMLSALDYIYKSFMIFNFFRYTLKITSWIFQFWRMFSLQALLNFVSILNNFVYWAESFLFNFFSSLYF